jgi:FlaA1/EpsC-like NDP-sugar epimerase
MRRVIDGLRARLRLGVQSRGAPVMRSIGAGQAPLMSDLLGRAAVDLDTPQLQRFLAGKRVLVTGAGGSIGSEICRQAMRFCPQRLLLVERAENSLFEIDRELRHSWVGADVRPLVGDVCDARRVSEIFHAHRPHVVFHCAAHKHVPMMEANPGEAIKNNVFGTKTAADAALAFGAQAFVLVSTDKAVNPSSVMGATKRFAELYVQSLNRPWSLVPGPLQAPAGDRPAPAKDQGPRTKDIPERATQFVAVRFGNVLGSSGSVVPIFQRQIEAGGPVTVTHPEMMRYFMTIPEASQLVMQAGALGGGGEIFVLDMGSPVRILDLARELIHRNGLRPDEDIEIRYCGVRPGEKLNEELAADGEATRPTKHPKIRVWQLPAADPAQVKKGLEILGKAVLGTHGDAVAALSGCVPEYKPDTPRTATSAASVRESMLINTPTVIRAA